MNRKYNPTILARKPEWSAGVIAAASLAEEYDSISSHEYNLGDCILLKFNLIKKNQVRKNKKRQTRLECR